MRLFYKAMQQFTKQQRNLEESLADLAVRVRQYGSQYRIIKNYKEQNCELQNNKKQM